MFLLKGVVKNYVIWGNSKFYQRGDALVAVGTYYLKKQGSFMDPSVWCFFAALMSASIFSVSLKLKTDNNEKIVA